MPFFQSAWRYSRQFLPRSKTVGSRESEFPSAKFRLNVLRRICTVYFGRTSYGPNEGKNECVWSECKQCLHKNDHRAAKDALSIGWTQKFWWIFNKYCNQHLFKCRKAVNLSTTSLNLIFFFNMTEEIKKIFITFLHFAIIYISNECYPFIRW